ncbi:MAG: hypothetical protein KIT32_12240 [Rhodocyclaceae bacterium]|nr:hypothetical protein [Rhodocyclaceae bacterium]
MTALWIKLGGALAALAAAAGLYAWITTAAFNRGYAKGEADTNARMAKVIEAQRRVATENAEKWKALPPSEKINELKRRCVAACEQEPKCIAACQ